MESPPACVTGWADSPEPASWATLPHDVPLHAFRRAQKPPPENLLEQLAAPPSADPSADPLAEVDSALYRAHPDWVLPIPPRAPVLRMLNLINEMPDLKLQVPDQRVVADYVIGERNGSRPLTPQMLVLLPDERRFYLLYRMPFTFPHVPRQQRSVRLRLDAAWYCGGQS